MKRTIHLHLGFHKTASTYLQAFLGAHRNVLSHHGCGYWGPEDLRPAFTTTMDRLARNVADSQAHENLREWRGKILDDSAPPTILLSEENLIGLCGELYFKGEVYFHRRERLRLLADLFDGCAIKIFVCVRSYVGYFPAAYTEMMRHQPFILFRNYLENLDLSGFSWTEIIREIGAELPESEIVAWRYEDFDSQISTIIDHLAGSPASEDFGPPPEVPTYQSPSHKAVSAMEALLGTLSPEEIRLLRNPIEQTFPKGQKYKGFDPWNWLEKARLDEQYQSDLEALAKLPQVRALYTGI